jgi:hypothetical protein
MADTHVWRAILRNGHEFNEFDAQGQDHSFTEIDPANVAILALVPLTDGFLALALAIPAEATAMFLRRRKVIEDSLVDSVTMIGYKLRDEYTYYWIFADGSIQRTSEDNVTLL